MFTSSTPGALEVDADWDLEMAWDAEVDAIAMSTSELLALLTDMPPDSFVMHMLAEVDIAALSDVDAVTYLQLHQRVTAWWMSRQFAAVLPATSPEPMRKEGIVLAMGSEEERTVWIEEWRREELALALRLPSATAQGLIDTARFLAGPLPRTREALQAGEVTDRHVAAIVRAAERLLAAHPRRDRGVLQGLRGAGATGAADRPAGDGGEDDRGGEPGGAGDRCRG